MVPKENTTPLLTTDHCLVTDPIKERITSLLGRCLATDPKELTQEKTPPLPGYGPNKIMQQTLDFIYTDK
jgi:hypothetical protein